MAKKMKNPHLVPKVFIPSSHARAVINGEGRLIRDLTMPAIDVSAYEAPAAQRRTSRIIRAAPERVTIRQAG